MRHSVPPLQGNRGACAPCPLRGGRDRRKDGGGGSERQGGREMKTEAGLTVALRPLLFYVFSLKTRRWAEKGGCEKNIFS